MFQSHIRLFSIALGIAVVGFVFDYFTNEQLKEGVLGPSRVLRVPLGRGLRGLLNLTLFSLVATGACFWRHNFYNWIPGINMALELGGKVGVTWVRILRGKILVGDDWR